MSRHRRWPHVYGTGRDPAYPAGHALVRADGWYLGACECGAEWSAGRVFWSETSKVRDLFAWHGPHAAREIYGPDLLEQLAELCRTSPVRDEV